MLVSRSAVLFLALTSAACSSPSGSDLALRGTDARQIAAPRVVAAQGESAAGAAGAAADSPDTAGAGAAPATSNECVPHEPVLLPDMSNARDLGGTPLADGQRVPCGAVYRGPPLSLSDDGCNAAAGLGLRTVLDLRQEGERLSVPDASCVDAARVFAPLPIPYGLAAADYLNVLHETSSIAVAFHTFADPAAYPIYFHCTYGRDRTGVVGALLLLALGADRATVMDEYLLSQPNVGAYPESLNAVLDEIEQRGGAVAVLKEAGISDAELTVLRAHAVARD